MVGNSGLMMLSANVFKKKGPMSGLFQKTLIVKGTGLDISNKMKEMKCKTNTKGYVTPLVTIDGTNGAITAAILVARGPLATFSDIPANELWPQAPENLTASFTIEGSGVIFNDPDRPNISAWTEINGLQSLKVKDQDGQDVQAPLFSDNMQRGACVRVILHHHSVGHSNLYVQVNKTPNGNW